MVSHLSFLVHYVSGHQFLLEISNVIKETLTSCIYACPYKPGRLATRWLKGQCIGSAYLGRNFELACFHNPMQIYLHQSKIKRYFL